MSVSKTASLPRIHVSENRRFLVTESGEPFFWLGDTAWELFHRSTVEEAEHYFMNRRQKGFTVIQAVILAEFGGLRIPNIDGQLPLIDQDPACPNEAYFRYVDNLIHIAADNGLYIGLLPTWGDKVFPAWAVAETAIFNQENAFIYGRWLGHRYQELTNLIWILGGDRPAVHEGVDDRPIWRAMAAGIDEGTSSRAIMTYHPNGGYSTSAWLHDEDWLDIHMMQSGHGSGRDVPVWEQIEYDYSLTPVKPTLDGEPNYEDHPVSPWPVWDPKNGYFRDYDVRKQLYRSVFAGGCGVTYGHHSVWQMFAPGRERINHAECYWSEALDRPGAGQVRYLRALMESRPYLTRIPDQSVLASEAGKTGFHVRATRDAQGSYIMIYLPTPNPVTVRLDSLSGVSINAWWYDPCSGEAIFVGMYEKSSPLTFTPPGHRPDWVLVLDDSSMDFPAPGNMKGSLL